jgi:hypothetical protein
MGQGKQKAEKLKAFLGSLDAEENVVFDLSQRLLQRFINPMSLRGACYRTSILMKRILDKEYQVNSDVVLGYVNDGDNVFISHAWLETKGKKTDLMIERPLHDVGRGPTVILDYEFKGTSNITYSYHLEKTAEALDTEAQMRQMPELGSLLDQKEAEHARIARALSSPEEMDLFLEEAAAVGRDGFTYMKVLQTIGT